MPSTPYINGQEIPVDPAALTAVVNPANGKAFSKVFMARPEHMTRAIDAAYAVKDAWGNSLPSERELILIRAADVLESMRNEVVDLLIEEGGATFGKYAVRSLLCRRHPTVGCGANAGESWDKRFPATFRVASR